jgi:hypothetical protein
MIVIDNTELHGLVRKACDAAIEYVNAPQYERDRNRLQAIVARIEAEMRLREFDEFQRNNPPWQRPQFNPWGC